MNLKMLGLPLATTAALVATATIATAPAQALQLKGTIGVAGTSTVGFNSISFSRTTDEVTFGTLDFAPLVGSTSTVIKTLNIFNPILSSNPPGDPNIITGRKVNAIPTFIDFGPLTVTRGANVYTGTLTFDLDAAENVVTTIVGTGSNPSISHSLNPLSGVFKFNGETVGRGFLNASRSTAGGTVSSTFQLTLAAQPIPTPALLPGLAALGAMALRKRKEEAEAEA